MSTFRFKHIETDIPELTTKTIDRKRYYITPEGKEYPSITTVLSNRGKKGLFEWRKRVGNDVANYISGKAAKRGTAVHHMCEDYLRGVNESVMTLQTTFLVRLQNVELRFIICVRTT